MKTAVGGMLAVLVVVGALLLLPWLIMLLAGALYHEFGFWQPISFVQAILIAVALSIVGSFFKAAR